MIPSLLSPLSIAPMIDWTNSYFRVLMRILAPKALVYTEMQTPGAMFNQPKRALYYDPIEHPIALQIGTSQPKELIECAKMAEDFGFDEINLNLGCPSDRVQAGKFGACLMTEPSLVADCIATMKSKVSIPVTAKTRIGIDHEDSYEFFANFVQTLVKAGSDKIIVHARKAWLKGLSPKQNRTIPPINYPYVYKIKQQFLNTPIIINGNIQTSTETLTHLQQVDGVMVGRLACQNPYEIAHIHHALFKKSPLIQRVEALEKYLDHIFSIHQATLSKHLVTKPILNLSHGLNNARQIRQQLLQADFTKKESFTQILGLFKEIS